MDCDRQSQCPYREICNHKDQAEFCSLIRQNCHSLEYLVEGDIRESSAITLDSHDKNEKSEDVNTQPLVTEKLIQWLSSSNAIGKIKKSCDK